MKAKVAPIVSALGLCLALAACSTYPEYPMTYQVPVGPAEITSAYGPLNLPVNGVQDVPAEPGQQLYFQVLAPTPIVLYAFDKTSTEPGGPLLAQLRGTSFYSSVTPTSSSVEFVVSTEQPVTGGSVQVTVSDQPMSSGASAMPYTNPNSGPEVGTAAQPPVDISPASVTIAPGQSVTFSVTGGAGTGAYVWGGAASATGLSNMFTFSAPGTYTVSVFHTGDETYAQSNTATATVTVSASNYVPGASQNVTVTPVR
jgi:plastocyanin